jgi:hypothetical protein
LKLNYEQTSNEKSELMQIINKYFLYFTFWGTMSLIATSLNAQLNSKDSAFLKQAIQNTIQVYHNGIGDQAAKFNGSQYDGYTVSFSDGHPYFKANMLSKGNIVYDGVLFENVNLLYDEVADCVILQDSTHRIKLVNERLSAFSLQESNFERLQKKGNSPLLTTGFYEVLSKGNLSLYKKETKKMIDKFSNANELAVLFEIHHYYYLQKGDSFYEIKRKKDLFKLLSDKASAITKYITEERLNYRKAKDLMLSKVIDYYNLLNQ